MDRDLNSPVCYECDGARQGVIGHNVRYVLGWGLVGVVLAFAAVAIAA